MLDSAFDVTASDRERPVPVVVLNWNGIEDTLRCVEHLLASRGVAFRAIVIDNGSAGDDYARLTDRFGNDPRVELRRNARNLGFARGVNRMLAELLADETNDRNTLHCSTTTPSRNRTGWPTCSRPPHEPVPGQSPVACFATTPRRCSTTPATCSSTPAKYCRAGRASRPRALRRSRGRRCLRRGLSAQARHAGRYRPVRRVLHHRLRGRRTGPARDAGRIPAGLSAARPGPSQDRRIHRQDPRHGFCRGAPGQYQLRLFQAHAMGGNPVEPAVDSRQATGPAAGAGTDRALAAAAGAMERAVRAFRIAPRTCVPAGRPARAGCRPSRWPGASRSSCRSTRATSGASCSAASRPSSSAGNDAR